MKTKEGKTWKLEGACASRSLGGEFWGNSLDKAFYGGAEFLILAGEFSPHLQECPNLCIPVKNFIPPIKSSKL